MKDKFITYLDFVRNVPAGGADEKVETDQVFKVQEQARHGVELIGQPEIGEGDVMKGGREDAEKNLDGPKPGSMIEDGKGVEEEGDHDDDDGEGMNVDGYAQGGKMRHDEEEKRRAPDDGQLTSDLHVFPRVQMIARIQLEYQDVVDAVMSPPVRVERQKSDIHDDEQRSPVHV